MTTTVLALFDTRREAERAEAGLARQGVGQDRVTLVQDTAKGVSMPAEERAAYDEGLRRGGTLLLARVDEDQVQAVILTLEGAGAVDLDRREQEWRTAGWAGAATGAAGRGQAAEAIPVVEERLVVGKRDVTRGTVRVRVHVREVPVEVPVHLREEHAVVERHKVDRPLTPADADALRDKVVQVVTKAEEPVVAKEAVVVEEIALRKEVAERVEVVRDTVRRTVVEVEADPGVVPRDGTIAGPGKQGTA